MPNSFKRNSKIACGDRVLVCGGTHNGKSGTIVSTRGSHINNFVMVQLDQRVQGGRSVGIPHPALRVGVSIRHVSKV
jgi:ribosomal protein S4E